MSFKQFWLFSIILIVVIGCQPVVNTEPESFTPSSPTPMQQTTLFPTTAPTLDRLTQLAITDLAQRLDLAPQLITAIEAESITWPDTSLDCPQPGVAYSQTLTQGFILRLEVQGQIYEYHTNTDGIVILCSPALEKNPPKDTDNNVEDGWPNQTKDQDVIIVTPTRP